MYVTDATSEPLRANRIHTPGAEAWFARSHASHSEAEAKESVSSGGPAAGTARRGRRDARGTRSPAGAAGGAARPARMLAPRVWRGRATCPRALGRRPAARRAGRAAGRGRVLRDVRDLPGGGRPALGDPRR